MLEQSLRRNIRVLYIFKAFRSALISIPVIVLFWQKNGLSQAQIYFLQSLFALGTIIFELPSGYLADRYGCRLSMLAGAVISTIGFGIYSFSFSFWPMAAAEIMLGIGVSCISGADAALAYDSLLALGESDQYRHFEAKGFTWSGLAEAGASILGGLIAIASLRATIVAQVAVYSLLIPLSLLLVEPVRQHVGLPAKNVLRDVAKITKYALHGHREIKWLIFYAAVIGTLTQTMVWLTQPFYQEAGVPIGWFGALWAMQMLALALFARCADRYEIILGKRRAMISFVVIGTATYAILSLAQSIWLLPVIFGFYFIRAVFTPILRDYINQLIESNIRATVLSVQSLAQRLLYMGAGPLIGLIKDNYSLSTALLFSAGFYALLGVFVIVMMKRCRII